MQSTQQIKEIENAGITNKYIDPKDLKKRVEKMFYDEYQIEELNIIQPTEQLSGLINLGNTCYINSFIHSLYHATKFRDFILQYKPHIDKAKVFSSFVNPIEEIMKVFLKMYYYPSQQDIDPKLLKLSLPEPFRSSFEQQDSGEFGRIYFDYIQNYLKETDTQDEIDKLFFGKIQNVTQCQNCKNTFAKTEKMLDIYVNFCEQAYNKGKNTYDLVSMIKNSFQAETFDENNAYFCEKCQKKTTAIKNTLVKDLPPILTIAVGRFLYDKENQERVKLLYPINLPSTFDLKDIFEINLIPDNQHQNLEYELFAFIVHLVNNTLNLNHNNFLQMNQNKGSQMDAGHYIAYCKNIEEPNGKWKLYDDNFVTEQLYSNANDLVRNFAESETPYILFYANKTQKPIELHKYIQPRSQIYQSFSELQESSNIKTNGYFFSQNSINEQTQNSNKLQNNNKK